MDQTNMKLVAMYAAMSQLLPLSVAMSAWSMGMTPDEARVVFDAWRSKLDTETFPKSDPATSDMLAAEIQEHVEDQLRCALTILKDLGPQRSAPR